jgi:WW domain
VPASSSSALKPALALNANASTLLFVMAAVQTRHLIAGAASDWIEVRDATAGEVWYYNPSTGESQWQRPTVLIGIMPSPERVRQLPALAATASSSSANSPNRQATSSSSTSRGIIGGSGASPQKGDAGLASSQLVSAVPCIRVMQCG